MSPAETDFAAYLRSVSERHAELLWSQRGALALLAVAIGLGVWWLVRARAERRAERLEDLERERLREAGRERERDALARAHHELLAAQVASQQHLGQVVEVLAVVATRTEPLVVATHAGVARIELVVVSVQEDVRELCAEVRELRGAPSSRRKA